MRRLLLTCAVLVGVATSAAAQTYRESPRTDLTVANAFVSLDTKGMGTAAISVAGTYSGTITFEVITADGQTQALNCTPPNSTTAVTTTTSTGRWSCSVAGFPTLRARMSSYSSGTAQVVLSAVDTGGGSGGSASIGSVTAGAQPANDPHYVRCSDGSTANPCLVTLSGTNNITNISGTISLPTGAATAANQSTEITALQLLSGTVFAEDAAHTTADKGIFILSKRTDSAASSAGTDGDYATLNTDASGRLWVNCGTGCSGGTQYAEDAAHVSGDSGTMALAIRQDTASTGLGADGDYAPLRLDSNGYLQIICKSGCTGGTGQTEDAAHSSGDSGSFMMGIRRDTTPSSSAGTAGDYTALNIDANGRLYTNGTLYTPNGDSAMDDTLDAVKVTNSTAATASAYLTVRLTDGSSFLTLGADNTLDSAIGTTGPLMVGRGSTATPTAMSADGDATAFWLDLNGRVHTTAEKAEDAAHTSGDIGQFVLGRRIDTLAASSGTSGDYEALNMNALGAAWVTPVPSTNGGLSIYRSIDLDEGSGEVVKSAPGQLYAMWVTNTATATRFLKIYDATSCTMGTGTPVITIGIPGNSSDDVAGNFGPGGMGIAFATGICAGATTGVADNDTGAPGANDVIADFYYK